ncbi:hypothetical protein [Methanopyrus sp.]
MEGIGRAESTEEDVILTERGEEFFGRAHESAEEAETIPQEVTWVEEPGECGEWRPRRLPTVPLPKEYLIVAAVAIGLLVAALLYYAR